VSTAIDHLVVAAETLEQGAEYIKEALGVDIPFGGEHPMMGTHNLLMQLGDALFLEVIAINPAATAPVRPRWFGLDDPQVRHRLQRGPTLLSWVVNTTDIKALMQAAAFSFGQPEQISRGDLSWLFGLPDDGRLLAGGLLPYLIEWQTRQHPAVSMQDNGCRLTKLTLFHSCADWLRAILASISIPEQVEVKALASNAIPYMLATIDTPDGLRTLRSDAPLSPSNTLS